MARNPYTYFILAHGANAVKIGKALNPETRLAELQVGNPDELDLLLVLPHSAPFEEHQLHWRFDRYRIRGEWFKYEGILKDFIHKKRLNPEPAEEDCLALAPPPASNAPPLGSLEERIHKARAGDMRKCGYSYPKETPRVGKYERIDPRTGFVVDGWRSPIFDLKPVFPEFVGTSQEEWNDIQASWAKPKRLFRKKS